QSLYCSRCLVLFCSITGASIICKSAARFAPTTSKKKVSHAPQNRSSSCVMASSIYGHAKYNKNVANNNRKIAYCFTSYSPFTCSSFYVSFVELRTVTFLFHLKNSVPYHLIILPSILLIKKVPNVAI